MIKKIAYFMLATGTFLISSNASAYWNNNDNDNVAYDAQGYTYRREGNIIYKNDGTTYYQSGNTITGTDGSYWQQSGNTYYKDGEEKCHEVMGRIICD